MTKIKVLSDSLKFTRAAGEYFVAQAQEAIVQHGHFSVALSGGETPANLYALLSSDAYAARVEWDKVYIFWGDERCVPPNHKDSNYGVAHQALLQHVPIPTENIFRMEGEIQPKDAAANYEARLREFFGTWGNQPRFDLVLLGLGPDGHTASLFPYSEALNVENDWVVAQFVESVRMWRITLTAAAINAAETILFLVTGSGKAERAREILEGPHDPERLPAQMIQPVDGEIIWLLDAEAAALLDQK
jgi:6-phosphogluconolactonase